MKTLFLIVALALLATNSHAESDFEKLRNAYIAMATPKLAKARSSGMDEETYKVYALVLNPASSRDACEKAVVKLMRTRYAATELYQRVTLADGHAIQDLAASLYIVHGSLVGLFEASKLAEGDSSMTNVRFLAEKEKLTLPPHDLLPLQLYAATQVQAASLYMQGGRGFKSGDMQHFTKEWLPLYLGTIEKNFLLSTEKQEPPAKP